MLIHERKMYLKKKEGWYSYCSGMVKMMVIVLESDGDGMLEVFGEV